MAPESDPALPSAREQAIQRAKEAFGKGEVAYRLGRFEEALKHYQEALTAKSQPAFLFNIAQCHRNLKRYERARFYYRLYLSEAPDAPNVAEVEGRIAEMDRAMEEEERKRPVSLSVTSTPLGATVLVDNEAGKGEVRTPVVLRLVPGSHLIVLRLPGNRDEVRRVEVRPGQPQVLEVTLVPLPKEASPITEPYHRRWWFWTGVSATALMLGVASGTGAQALRMKDRWEKTGGDPDVSYDFRARSLALRVTTDVLLGAATLTAVGTLVGALLVSRARRERAEPTTHIVPACGTDGCGLFVTGRF